MGENESDLEAPSARLGVEQLIAQWSVMTLSVTLPVLALITPWGEQRTSAIDGPWRLVGLALVAMVALANGLTMFVLSADLPFEARSDERTVDVGAVLAIMWGRGAGALGTLIAATAVYVVTLSFIGSLPGPPLVQILTGMAGVVIGIAGLASALMAGFVVQSALTEEPATDQAE